jgi:hypothetical protein
LMIMIAQWVEWRPSGRRGRLHRMAVVCLFILGTALMMFWAWLYFSGYWAS